jgi:hypothetical protein
MKAAIIYFAVAVVWPSSVTPPVVTSVQFPSSAACEAGKASVLARAVAVVEAHDFSRTGMKTFVVCSKLDLKSP